MEKKPANKRKISPFNRKFFDGEEKLSAIGSGAPGGKASGLAFIEEIISEKFKREVFPEIEVAIPTMTVIKSDVFDAFMKRNNLYELEFSSMPDDLIAHKFQKADLPAEILGDLRSLIKGVNRPLAIRSSSILEDAMYEPFAGIYATKMIPNNQFDTDERFRRLVEAIKFVYASTYFKDARDYIKATTHKQEEEKMSVIIQEVVGKRHGDRFYPVLSGVARSYNFYTTGHARPEEGVVNLALGLGKTIVDGGKSWSYSPAYPRANPPYGSVGDLLKATQINFWAVNMGKPPAYDPVKETEYLIKAGLMEAEEDGCLRYIASTYHDQSDRLYPGTGYKGPRALTFAPLLSLEEIPLNNLLKTLLKISEEALGAPVEIEFAMTFEPGKRLSGKFGLLQVRPMVVSSEEVEITEKDMTGEKILLASESVLGNGIVDNILDIVYVKPESFNAKYTRKIAGEVSKINEKFLKERIPYLLIGFGRWGSSDPWLGIPVNWGQIGAAKVIVESTLLEINVDLSQGSHFFHNISSFQVSYFSLHHSGKYKIDWPWLEGQEKVEETEFLRHVRLKSPLTVRVDGRSGKGVISY